MLNCLLFTDHMFAPREGSSRREEEGELAEVTRCNMSDSYNKEYASQHQLVLSFSIDMQHDH